MARFQAMLLGVFKRAGRRIIREDESYLRTGKAAFDDLSMDMR
jgi:hypothetical protein